MFHTGLKRSFVSTYSQIIPLQIKAERRLWLSFYLGGGGRTLSGELMCQFQDVPH